MASVGMVVVLTRNDRRAPRRGSRAGLPCGGRLCACLAGDVASATAGAESLIAGDLIDALPRACGLSDQRRDGGDEPESRSNRSARPRDWSDLCSGRARPLRELGAGKTCLARAWRARSVWAAGDEPHLHSGQRVSRCRHRPSFDAYCMEDPPAGRPWPRRVLRWGRA